MEDKKHLIYKEDLLSAIRDDLDINGTNFAMVKKHINELPTVEVEHGRWEAAGFDCRGDYKECCSNCKAWSVGDDKLYCPVCGARMDLEE